MEPDTPEESPPEEGAPHTSLETDAATATVPTVLALAPEEDQPPRAGWWWLLPLLLAGIAAPFIPVPALWVALAVGSLLIILYTFVVVRFAAAVSAPPAGRLVLPFALALVWWIGLQWVLIPGHLLPFVDAMRAAGGAPTGGQLLLLHLVTTLANLSLLAAATLGGALVGQLIRTPNMLGPVCLVIALLDIWGVLLGGIVTQLLEKAPQVSAHAMTSLPAVGAARPGSYPVPLPEIGAGDYLFLGLLFAALHRQHMNWRGALRWITPLMAAALLAVGWGVPRLPGLLFIGLGAAIPNLRYFKYTREEKFALLYAGLLILVLTALLYGGITALLETGRVP